MHPTSLVLVRHGHTSANGGPAGMRMSGWTDTPLSDDGRCEALRVADALRRESPFAAMYASPLLRTRQTAEAIAAALGLPARVEPGLREIFCGDVEGWSVEEVRSRHPGAWSRNAEERDEGFRWPGGESYRELRARCLWTLRALAARHPGGRVLVVTHAGVISQVVGWVLGESCARWSAYRPANASLTRLEWDRGLRSVVSFDERAHLPALARRPARSQPRAG